MTLTKAIEAAREGLLVYAKRENLLVESMVCNPVFGESYIKLLNKSEAHKALAALPDKPMTEGEIKSLCFEDILRGDYGAMDPVTAIELTIRALKAANVLFVKED